MSIARSVWIQRENFISTKTRCFSENCPGENALTEEFGHLKKNCKAYSHGKTIPYIKENYHIDGYGCGFCQTNVPCESSIPPGIEVKEVVNED